MRESEQVARLQKALDLERRDSAQRLTQIDSLTQQLRDQYQKELA